MPVISLFHLEIKPEEEKNFLADFVVTLSIAQKQKGFINAQAYVPVGQQHKYLLITEWESEADIENWLDNADHQRVIAKAPQYVANHSIKRYTPK